MNEEPVKPADPELALLGDDEETQVGLDWDDLDTLIWTPPAHFRDKTTQN